MNVNKRKVKILTVGEKCMHAFKIKRYIIHLKCKLHQELLCLFIILSYVINIFRFL